MRASGRGCERGKRARVCESERERVCESEGERVCESEGERLSVSERLWVHRGAATGPNTPLADA